MNCSHSSLPLVVDVVPLVSLSELDPVLVGSATVAVLDADVVVAPELELAAVVTCEALPVGSLLPVPWSDVLGTSVVLVPESPWLSDCGVASPGQPIAPMASDERSLQR